MRKRWLVVFILIYAFGVMAILLTACAYNGNVTINTKDSFRLISPDFELHPKVCNTETIIDNDDDDNLNKEEEK
jgi:hypothetical protein